MLKSVPTSSSQNYYKYLLSLPQLLLTQFSSSTSFQNKGKYNNSLTIFQIVLLFFASKTSSFSNIFSLQMHVSQWHSGLSHFLRRRTGQSGTCSRDRDSCVIAVWLLQCVVRLSVVRWHRCVHTCLASLFDLPRTSRGHHRAPSWAPCALQRLCLFHTWRCVYVSPTLPTHPTQPFAPCVHTCLSLYSCPADRFISTIFLECTYMC